MRIHIAGTVGDLQRELRDFLGCRGQFVIDVLAIGLGVVGLREADDETAVLAAFLDERRRGRRAGGKRQRAYAEHQRGWLFHEYKRHDFSLPV